MHVYITFFIEFYLTPIGTLNMKYFLYLVTDAITALKANNAKRIPIP